MGAQVTEPETRMNYESQLAIIDSRRIEQLSAVGISDTCGNIMGIVVISILYWPYLTPLFIIPWATLSILSLILRIYKIREFLKTPDHINPESWRQYYFNNALLNGIAWCLMLICATYAVPLELLPYIVMIIAGLTAAPSLNFYNFPDTHAYFAIPAIIPGALALIVSAELALVVLGFMALSWFAITRTNANVLSREGEECASYEATQLEFEQELQRLKKSHLINQEELQIQTEILASLNRSKQQIWSNLGHRSS